jgi:hypothetical protein
LVLAERHSLSDERKCRNDDQQLLLVAIDLRGLGHTSIANTKQMVAVVVVGELDCFGYCLEDKISPMRASSITMHSNQPFPYQY